MEQAAAVRATPENHPPRRAHSELIYGIDEVPPQPQTLFAQQNSTLWAMTP